MYVMSLHVPLGNYAHIWYIETSVCLDEVVNRVLLINYLQFTIYVDIGLTCFDMYTHT